MRRDNDCAIWCMARLLNLPYSEVAAVLPAPSSLHDIVTCAQRLTSRTLLYTTSLPEVQRCVLLVQFAKGEYMYGHALLLDGDILIDPNPDGPEKDLLNSGWSPVHLHLKGETPWPRKPQNLLLPVSQNQPGEILLERKLKRYPYPSDQ